MHKFKYNKTPVLRRGSGYIVPLLSKKLFAIGNMLGKGKSVFSKRKSLHVSTIPQGKPYDQESLLHVVCCCCLFWYVLSYGFLSVSLFFKIEERERI